jgi:RNA polymerase sigma factor (sigma-70 family)
MLSEAESYLLNEVRAKDSQAWTQLVARFQGRLLAFTQRRVPARADAEDIVQETFVSLLQSLGTFRGEASLETHLFGLLRKRIADFYRRLGQRDDESLCEISTSRGQWHAEPLASNVSASWYVRRVEEDDQAFGQLAAAVLSVTERWHEELNFRDLIVAEATLYAQLRNQVVAELIGLQEQQVALIKHRLIKRISANVHASSATQPEWISENLLSRVWESFRPSCPKRTTIGKYLLQTLPTEWHEYVDFHLRKLACRFCLANEDDLKQSDAQAPDLQRRIFQSTVGFLKQ